MKKLITVILLAILSLSLFGCDTKPDYYALVSEERRDVLFGESENFSVKCYAEIREKPFKPDGKKQQTAFAVIIKLTVKSGINGILDGAKVTFSTDKDYSALFTFHRESDEYVAISYVSELPDKQATVKIETDRGSEELELSSVLSDIEFTPKAALDLVVSSVGNEYEAAARKGEMEIYIRLIYGDEIFYYVGLITENKTDAFLVDKECKKIVAKKSVSN